MEPCAPRPFAGRGQPAQILCGIAGPPVAAHAGVVHHAPGSLGLPADVLCAVMDRDALPDPPEQAVRRGSLFRTGADAESPGGASHPAGFWHERGAIRAGGEGLLSRPSRHRHRLNRSRARPEPRARSASPSPPLRPLDVGGSVQDVVDGPGAGAGGGNGVAFARTSRPGRERPREASSPTQRRTTRSPIAPWPGRAWSARNSIRPSEELARARELDSKDHLDTVLSGAGEISCGPVERKADSTVFPT